MTIKFRGVKLTKADVRAAMDAHDLLPASERHAWLLDDRYRYVLIDRGHAYPPKAILSTTTGLSLKAFSGGEQATNRVLQDLGFEVVNRHTVPGWLLTWNPKMWTWSDHGRAAQALAHGKPFIERWSCGNTKRILPGQRAFLMRVGVEPRGLIATGIVVRGSYEDDHWDLNRRLEGKTCYFVDVLFTRLSQKEDAPLIRTEDLDALGGKANMWSPQSSGVHLSAPLVMQLEGVLQDDFEPLPEEISIPALLPEGAHRTIAVNRYERNRRARTKCLEHHGYRCAICSVGLEELYGSVAAGFIHVHHVTPLSEIGGGYEVDPVNDLRPVCPTCHAVIHLRRPPYSINEVRTLMASSGSTG